MMILNKLYILSCSRTGLRPCFIKFVRYKSITGYDSADSALQKVTGGRINRWLDAYEDFVGLTEVRHAQEHVTKAETEYRITQEERRATQHLLTSIQSRIKDVALEIEKTQRGTDAYLDLVTKENEIIKEEKDVLDQLTASEENEKHFFGLLSSALRESHEKERARAERMKYWGVIGSIIGAVIGIFGTTANNYLRMKELRGIVTSATEMNQVYKEQTMNLYVSVNEQYGKIYQFLSDIRSATGIKQDSSPVLTTSTDTVVNKSNIKEDIKFEEISSMLKTHQDNIGKEIQKLGQVLAVKDGKPVEGSVVYVGPEMESMLKESEKNLEWKMKIQSLGTVTLIYAVGAVCIPLIWKIFGGS